ncbi:pro-sigmaK processing inhibitor BofA family protein [Paenibacillus hexagrammi]|uniref:Pro-sigmaK processing inhibitor BofA family protein n=1 Tax=Paenibacillus hexagrammi TaxID=2908839 RepID=A0ABY3SIN1_9BACL|nr:pro-sigmaK processing inhibitor BofA family protein [Paenibacillus sp. YPD9-1]UJF33648.1 pro-sigmaK processing inhibitor BofA family protein [Paenibacillus sp. YPD9-1]
MLSGLAINVVIAAVMLYALNLLSGYTNLEMPINTTTLATATLLGVPGVILLVGVKLILI